MGSSRQPPEHVRCLLGIGWLAQNAIVDTHGCVCGQKEIECRCFSGVRALQASQCEERLFAGHSLHVGLRAFAGPDRLERFGVKALALHGQEIDSQLFGEWPQ